MVSFIAVLVRLGSALSRALRSPEFRGLSVVVLVLLVSGTFLAGVAQELAPARDAAASRGGGGETG